MRQNYFIALMNQLHDKYKKTAEKQNCRVAYGTVINVSPLLIRMENGIELPESKFMLSDFVEAKRIRCSAKFTGAISGDIGGNVSIAGTSPGLSADGPISGDITIDGLLEGIFETSALWTGLEVGDRIMMTRHNSNQMYLIHCVTNREPQAKV